jgi:biotin operon repressor
LASSGLGPLAAARLRGVEKQPALLEASGGILSAEQTAAVLGISRQAVDKRRRQGRLIGLTQGRRGYAFPAWQFANGRPVPHVEQVLDLLNEHDPWGQLSFFLNANDRLNGKSPSNALRQDQVESVQLAARSFGEHSAA